MTTSTGSLTNKISTELIVEPHPKEYSGLPFVTLIQYRKAPMLAIIDNATKTTITGYILDLCGAEKVDEEVIIEIAAQWYDTNKKHYPISIEFSKRGLTQATMRIYKSMNVEFVSRAIGPVPMYPMSTTSAIKRRKRKAICIKDVS